MGVEGDCDGSVSGMVFRSVKAECGYLNECVVCVVIYHRKCCTCRYARCVFAARELLNL